ncbi:MAG: hypothetical protein ABI539_03125 [Acidobacteriota bacterium]
MKMVLIAFVILAAMGTCLAQDNAKLPAIQTVELQNSTHIPVSDRMRYQKACLNLRTLERGCGAFPAIHFGDQIGVNVNLFQVNGGIDDRTRMVRIGKFNWTDKFTVPSVTPWEPLESGEQRIINVNASGANGTDGAPGVSGADGADGVAGMNGDGTYTPTVQITARAAVPSTARGTRGINYATADVTVQVNSSIKGRDGKVRQDPYTPYVEAKLGYMYAVHVVDGEKDYYMLIRVDEIIDGRSVKLSFIKIDLPTAL